MRDEVPVQTYYVLASLLLGNVKIYAQQVQYLLQDSDGCLSQIKQLILDVKRSNIPAGLLASPPPIVIPQRMALDSFDLQVQEHGQG